jgi:hypothetical protein
MAEEKVKLIIRREAREKTKKFLSFETQIVNIADILDDGLSDYLDSKTDAYGDESGVSTMSVDYITSMGTDMVIFDRYAYPDMPRDRYMELCENELKDRAGLLCQQCDEEAANLIPYKGKKICRECMAENHGEKAMIELAYGSD